MELGEEIGGQEAPRGDAGAKGMESVQAFIGGFGEAFNLALQEPANAVLFAEFFTESFVVVNPNGVMSWRNDASLPLAKGFEFYRRIGVRRARISSLSTEPLDAMHSQAKVCTEMVLRRAGGAEESVSFDVIYFLQRLEGRHRIFCMISDDEWRVWRQKGLLSGPGSGW